MSDYSEMLEQIKKRIQKATPGQWTVDPLTRSYASAINAPDPRHPHGYRKLAYMAPFNLSRGFASEPQREQAHCDADFIANARNDIETLLGLIEKKDSCL